MATEESAHEIDALEADAGQAGKISKLVTLEQFIEIYKTYKDETVALYNVLRDLLIKRDCRFLHVVDGSIWGQNKYFLVGNPKNVHRRVYVLISVEDDIDFSWLHQFYRRVLSSDPEGTRSRITLCIYDQDSIIYEEFFMGLPETNTIVEDTFKRSSYEC